tara:strand:- start:42 stop:434 length:393 start_codon:yes stop_codon:yes gene_type:complete
MNDITKTRVIDWDKQLRKERDLKKSLGDSWSISQVKELTGSYRRLTENDKNKIGKGILSACEEFYLSLDTIARNAYSQICKNRSSAHFSINNELSNKEDDPAFKDFLNWDNKLQDFKKNNGWERFNKRDE